MTSDARKSPTIDAGHMISSTWPRSTPLGARSTTSDAVAAETGLQRMPTCEATAETDSARSGRIFWS